MLLQLNFVSYIFWHASVKIFLVYDEDFESFRIEIP